MIQMGALIGAIRKDHADMEKSKYSDWEIFQALNRALRMISNEMAMRNTDFLEKSVTMLKNPTTMTVTAPDDARIHRENFMGEPLPDDFISEVTVRRLSDGYKLHPSQGLLDHSNYLIYQGSIFALNPIVLKYRCVIPDVTTTTTSIDLPISFFDFLVASTGIALDAENVDALTTFVSENAMKLIPSRRYGNARVSMPWRV